MYAQRSHECEYPACNALDRIAILGELAIANFVSESVAIYLR